jgi:hypothetical protein
MTNRTGVIKTGDTIRFSTGRIGKVLKEFSMPEELSNFVSGIDAIAATSPAVTEKLVSSLVASGTVVLYEEYRPYLIQRLSLRGGHDPEVKLDTLRFGELFSMDYMGAAEFEFGAMAKNLREFHAQDAEIDHFSFKHNERWYYGFYNSAKFDLTEVIEKLKKLDTKGMYQKEHADFPYKKGNTVSAWFDIRNQVFFGIHNLYETFRTVIGNSITYMDSQ